LEFAIISGNITKIKQFLEGLMKALICICVALFCLVTVHQVAAQQKLEITVKPTLSVGSGCNKYSLNVSEYDEDFGGFIGAKSELEFPINSAFGGLSAKINPSGSWLPKWSFEIGLSTNMGNPSKKMKDSDWIIADGYEDFLFSYTESEEGMRAVTAYLEGRLAINRSPTMSFGILAGLRLEDFRYDVLGFSGWQYVYDEGLDSTYKIFGEMNDSTLMGTYKVSYTMPEIGFFIESSTMNSTSFDAHVAFTRFHVSDRDYHLFRGKVSYSEGSGNGFIAGANLRHSFPLKKTNLKPFIEIGGQLITMSFEGTQDQYWYADDPASEDDDTGTYIHDIDYKISSNQVWIHLRAGLSL
jgi:hypothetical protein